MFKISILVVSLFVCVNANTFKDMLGHDVPLKKEIKDIQKIYASSPVLLYSLYVIDKEKIAGLNFPFYQGEAKYLDQKIIDLPVLGGWFGKGRTPNSEMILQVNPDVILVSEFTKRIGEQKIKDSLGNRDIPLVYLKSNTLEELVDSFSYLGKLTNQEEKAKKLQQYGTETLLLTKSIISQVSKKPKVYYAEGKNGLQTECHTSIHSELINLAGGDNVHKCQVKNQFGKQTINFEQLLTYNPEIILVYDKEFYDNIYKNTQWQHLKAVKNKQVYFLPKGPFSWFDRPPSFMKLLGLKWLLSIFHPNIYQLDIEKEAKSFYKLFLNMELSDKQLTEIMGKDID